MPFIKDRPAGEYEAKILGTVEAMFREWRVVQIEMRNGKYDAGPANVFLWDRSGLAAELAIVRYRILETQP